MSVVSAFESPHTKVKIMDVIKRLNDLRLQRNLSVYRLSELSGVNQSTLANTFSRGIVPSVQNLEKICDAMGITLSQFFSEDQEFTVLTKNESELICNYRNLPGEAKKSVGDLVKSISEMR